MDIGADMTNQEKVDALLEHMKAHKNKWFSISVLSKLFGLTKSDILAAFATIPEIKKFGYGGMQYGYVDKQNNFSLDRLSREYKPNAAMVRAMDRVGEVYPPEHRFIGINGLNRDVFP